MDFDSLFLDLHAQKNKVACSTIILNGKTLAGAVLGACSCAPTSCVIYLFIRVIYLFMRHECQRMSARRNPDILLKHQKKKKKNDSP